MYGSACQSDLKQLDPIHNQALRLCPGAFRSSPLDIIYVEANEPSLRYCRSKLSMQYGIKLKANPDIPSHEFVFPTDFTYTTCERDDGDMITYQTLEEATFACSGDENCEKVQSYKFFSLCSWTSTDTRWKWEDGLGESFIYKKIGKYGNNFQ